MLLLAASLPAQPVAATRAVDVPVIGTAAQGPVISSTAPGALTEPRRWTCDRIVPDYRKWLREGNRPEKWRHVGKTYRDAQTGETYGWNDWLDWKKKAGCGVVQTPEARRATGGGVWLLGMALLLIVSGRGPDSPG